MPVFATHISETTTSVRGVERPAPHAAKTSDFLSQLKAASAAPQDRDAVSLSGGSYEARLNKLRKLHENTDYSQRCIIETIAW